MIYINENAKEKIKQLKYDNFYVVADFDKTITDANSESSWGVLAESGLVPEEYIEERNELVDHYYPLELDLTIPLKEKHQLMTEWWEKHIALFIKYKMPEQVVIDAANDINIMQFRPGAESFLEKMNQNNVPFIIISAGIGDFIEKFLCNHNYYFDNTYVLSNFFKFENGIAVGMSDQIVHVLNKSETSLPEEINEKIKGREYVILLGDSLNDIDMVSHEKRDETIRVGFLEKNVEANFEEFKASFDIVCTDNTSFEELLKVLKLGGD